MLSTVTKTLTLRPTISKAIAPLAPVEPAKAAAPVEEAQLSFAFPLPKLPVSSTTHAAPAEILERVGAPLPTRRSNIWKAFKKSAPLSAACGVGATALVAAMAGGQHGDGPLFALGAGVMVTAIGTAIFSIGDGLLPTEPRDAARVKATEEAVSLVADAIRALPGEPWSSLIASVKADARQVSIELDPLALNALPDEQRATLQTRLAASLPDAVRTLLPHVSVVLHNVSQDAKLTPPSRAARTIGGAFGSLFGLAGAIPGGFIGMIPGGILGIGAWAATAVLGGAFSTFFLSPSAHHAVMEFAPSLIQMGACAGMGLGALLGALGGATGWASASITSYRQDLERFRADACKALHPYMVGMRGSLSAEWQKAIGEISIGKDEEGRDILTVAKSDTVPPPGDEDALKAAFAALMPPELAKPLAHVPLHFGRPTARPRAPNLGDYIVRKGAELAKAIG